MKKLLIGLTLIASMSSIADTSINHSSCTISKIKFENTSDSSKKLDKALDMNKVSIVKDLERKGYHFGKSDAESLGLTLNYQALEHQSCQGCDSNISDIFVSPAIYVSELFKKNTSMTGKLEKMGTVLDEQTIKTYTKPNSSDKALSIIDMVIRELPDCNQV